jgi:hypothetical protein
MPLLPSASINTFDVNKASAPSFFQGQFQSDVIVRDPYVTGYSFVKWLTLPSWVTDTYREFAPMTEKNLRAFSGINDIEMNTWAIQEGFSGSENSFAGGAQKFQGFSMTHREYSGSPIRNAYTWWVTGIRDPATNIATYPKIAGVPYSAANHTGELIYIVTRPDADNVGSGEIIEFSCLYTMVMPTKIPLSHLNFTAGSSDGVEIEMNFVGVPHISPAVDELAISTLQSLYSFSTMGDFAPAAAG